MHDEQVNAFTLKQQAEIAQLVPVQPFAQPDFCREW